MKNKKAVYILIPAVLLIWGTIFYKIYKSTKSDSFQPAQPVSHQLTNEKYELDTFSLMANYDDPFLKRYKSEEPKPAAITQKQEKSQPKVEPKPVKWPSISYGGTVSNKDTKQELVIVIVNGTSHLMKKKEVKSNVQLLEVLKDSILVSYEDEKKYVRK